MRSRPLSSAMSRPSKAIVPAVGCSIFKISLAVVVLPHPDSPMSPSVSPAWMAKSTPSTAFTQVAPRPNSPCRAGKCFASPRTSRTGSAMEPAPGDASVGEAEVPGLVGDDEPRPSRQRDGADDALPHAAAHLVGILAHPPLGGGDPDGAEKVLHALAQRAAAQVLVKERGLRHLSEDGEERVERRHRILQDHGDAPATDAAQLTLALAGQVFSVEDDAASHDARGALQEPDDGQARSSLAAPWITDT